MTQKKENVQKLDVRILDPMQFEARDNVSSVKLETDEIKIRLPFRNFKMIRIWKRVKRTDQWGKDE
jgi:hypothetical protein